MELAQACCWQPNRPEVISKVFVSGGFSSIDGFNDESKVFWSTVTPEIIEQNLGELHRRYQQQYPENDWKTLINDLRNMVNHDKIYITEEKLKRITAKVLLAWGDNDLFTWEHIAYLDKTISNTELMILPGTGHNTFDEQPEMVSLAIKCFFAK